MHTTTYNDVCRRQHSVLHTLTNYLHILSQSSHTEGQRHPLGPRCLAILTDGDVAGPAWQFAPADLC